MAIYGDIIALQGKMNDNAVVGKLIEADLVSEEKSFMKTADRYYENKNDIFALDFRKYFVDGKELINENRSNKKLSHNFFELLVNQAANYVVGNPITYQIDDEAFQKYLDEYLMFDFNDNNIAWLTDARKKGRSYLHVYYDAVGRLCYAVIPAQEIIPIYTDEFSKKLQSVIRYYFINGVNAKGQAVLRKKVEWWDDKECKIFLEDDSSNFYLLQTLPHWTTRITTQPTFVDEHSWGRVPFIQLFNNDTATSDLKNIKGFIDAYDLIASEFINQIADIREILVKVLGHGEATASEILQAFKATGIVKLDDEEGDIDVIKTEIPVEARQATLKILKENIFMIGQGVDTNPEKIETNISGIALKMLYGALDLKCNPIIRKMHKALYEFIWFIADDYNRTKKAAINYRDVKFTFNKNMIINEAEIITSLKYSKGLISDKTIRANHPFVTDVTEEEKRMDEQDEKEMDEFNKQVKSSSPNTGNKE